MTCVKYQTVDVQSKVMSVDTYSLSYYLCTGYHCRRFYGG